MRVYRFELKFSILHKTYCTPSEFYSTQSVGPFARYQREYSLDCGYDRLQMKTPCLNQPEPEDDGLVVKFGYAFACRDCSELIAFFYNDLGRLHRSGFAVFEYEVPDHNIEHGGHQVQYHPDNATLVRMLTIKELKEEARQNKQHMQIVMGLSYSMRDKEYA